MKSLLLMIIFWASCQALTDDLFNYRSKQTQLFRKVVNQYYDKDERPPGIENVEDPITIATSLYIHDIHFCSKRQTLTVGGYFRQKWVDRRLQASTKPEEKGLLIKKFHDMFDDSAIWVPDTFVMGSFKNFVQDAPARSFLRLNADGSVKSSFRLKSETSCPFGEDDSEVECTLSFESYGYTTDDIQYEWDETPVMISDNGKELLEHNGWAIVDTNKLQELHETTTGKYSTIGFNIKLKRV